jgi:hypothetical protein
MLQVFLLMADEFPALQVPAGWGWFGLRGGGPKPTPKLMDRGMLLLQKSLEKANKVNPLPILPTTSTAAQSSVSDWINRSDFTADEAGNDQESIAESVQPLGVPELDLDDVVQFQLQQSLEVDRPAGPSMSLRDIYLCQEVKRRKSEREEPPSSPHLLAQDQGVQGLQQVQASDHAEGVLPGEEDDG